MIKNYEEINDTFNMKINTNMKRDFKLKCVTKGTDMSKVLKEFIVKYIKEK